MKNSRRPHQFFDLVHQFFIGRHKSLLHSGSGYFLRFGIEAQVSRHFPGKTGAVFLSDSLVFLLVHAGQIDVDGFDGPVNLLHLLAMSVAMILGSSSRRLTRPLQNNLAFIQIFRQLRVRRREQDRFDRAFHVLDAHIGHPFVGLARIGELDLLKVLPNAPARRRSSRRSLVVKFVNSLISTA